MGGAGGFHRGVKEAYEAGFDLIWIMDDDVITAPDSLLSMLTTGREVPDYGFLASRVVGVDGQPLNVPGWK